MLKQIFFIRPLIVSVFFFLFVDVMAMEDATIEEKQQFLQENILGTGYNADEFMEFLQSKKMESGLDLNNWQMGELKQVVKEFKQAQEGKQRKQQMLDKEILGKGYDKNSFVNFVASKKEGGENVNNWQMEELKQVVREFKQVQEKKKMVQEEILKKGYGMNKFESFVKKKKKGEEGKYAENWGTKEFKEAIKIFQKEEEENQKKVEGNLEGNNLSHNKIARRVFDFYRYGGKFLASLVWSVVNSYYGFEEIVMNDWYCFKYAMCSGYRLQPRFMGFRVWIDMNFNFLEGIAGFLIRFFLFNSSYKLQENIFDFFNVCINMKVYNNLYFAVNIVGIVQGMYCLKNDNKTKNNESDV